MAEFTTFKGYTGDRPQPETPPDPMIVTVQQGVPIVYPNCVAPAGIHYVTMTRSMLD